MGGDVNVRKNEFVVTRPMKAENPFIHTSTTSYHNQYPFIAHWVWKTLRNKMELLLPRFLAVICITRSMMSGVQGRSMVPLPSTRVRSASRRKAFMAESVFKKMTPKNGSRSNKVTLQHPIVSAGRILAPRILECTVAAESTVFLSKFFGIQPTATLTLANVAIYLTWLTAISGGRECRALLAWMNFNFMTPYDKRQLQLRPHTILLSAFSHIGLEHLTGNMSLLMTVGPFVEKSLGIRHFSYFYILSAYAADVFALWIHKPLEQTFKRVFLGEKPSFLGRILFRGYDCSIGASGAISSVFAYFCLEFPKKVLTLELSGEEKEYPAWAVGCVFVLMDLFQVSSSSSKVGHGSHLGGYVFGAAVFFLRRFLRSCRVTKQRTKSKEKIGSIFFWKQEKKQQIKEENADITLQKAEKQGGSWDDTLMGDQISSSTDCNENPDVTLRKAEKHGHCWDDTLTSDQISSSTDDDWTGVDDDDRKEEEEEEEEGTDVE